MSTKSKPLPHSVTKKPGFARHWINVATKPTITPDNFYTMKVWQREAFAKLIGQRFGIMNVPPGGGKSIGAEFIATEEMIRNPSLKTIIAVPQTLIGRGFTDANLQFDDGRKIVWSLSPQYNLLNDEGKITNQSMVDRAKAFLIADTVPELLQTRTLLVSHQTLVALYKCLSSTDQLSLLEYTSIFIDEAHHVKNSTYEDGTEVLDQNFLGELVYSLLQLKTANVMLMTATFYRGDKLAILPDKDLKKFSRYNLPFDTYLSGLQNLKELSFDFLIYKICPCEAISELFKGGPKKTIIYIPPVNSKYAQQPKRDLVNKIIKTIGEFVSEDEEGVIHVKNGTKNITILDLVEDGYAIRKKRKAFFEKHSKDNDGCDVVIALGMAKEGANWDCADRVIIIGSRNSLPEINQICGRPLRDANGKIKAEIYQLLPQTFETNGEGFREYLNDYLNTIFTSMLLENVFFPHHSDPKPASRKPRSGYNIQKNNAFIELDLSDQNKINAFKDIYKKALEIGISGIRKDHNRFNLIVADVLNEYNVSPEQHTDVADDLWLMMCRRTKVMEGVDPTTITDAELLKNGDPLGFVLSYTTGVTSIDTFDKLRDCIIVREDPLLKAEAIFARAAARRALPARTSTDEQERRDETWICHMKQAKKGKDTSIWNQKFEKISNRFGFYGVFDIQNAKDLALAKCTEIAERAKARESLPKQTIRDKQQMQDSKWIWHMKKAKQGTHKNRMVWYPEFSDIFAKYGFPGIFGPLKKNKYASKT